MIEKEIERKAILTKEQYESLLGKIVDKPVTKKVQINYYYDTDDYILLSNDETLRVRQIEDKLELQYKYNKKIESGVRISNESCDEINYLPEKIAIDGLIVKRIGFLLTERRSKRFDGYIIFLDKNYYLGKVDYEIEMEAINIEYMPTELYGISFNTVCKGKYTRFTDELLKQRDIYEISR